MSVPEHIRIELQAMKPSNDDGGPLGFCRVFWKQTDAGIEKSHAREGNIQVCVLTPYERALRLILTLKDISMKVSDLISLSMR
jgi:hypothetical protein